jgi:ABC-type sugar transport system ATPase subunit
VLDGEFVALVGPAGSNKSTLLNAAAGLLKQSAGTCRILGREVNGIDERVGYLFRSDALMPWKTALEKVAIGLEIRGTKMAKRGRKRKPGSPGSVYSDLPAGIHISFPAGKESALPSPKSLFSSLKSF